MNPTNRSTMTRRARCAWTAAVAAFVLGLLTLSPLPAGAQTADGPTAAFCEAWADYQDAQDGAELNTALGAMQEALTPDAPAEIAEALVTLGQGDLDPAEVQAASDVVAAWADEPCAETSTTTASTTSTTASSTTATTADSDDGSTPSGGVDTGAGGTADDGPIGLGLVVTAALVAAGVGLVLAADRRRVTDRR